MRFYNDVFDFEKNTFFCDNSKKGKKIKVCVNNLIVFRFVFLTCKRYS